MEPIRKSASGDAAPPEEHVRVALIGAGPIGIELAVALKRAAIPYVHLEASAIASTIHWYPPEMHFHSSAERIAVAGAPFQIPGQEKPTREHYLAYLRSVVQQFSLEIRCYERVEDAQCLGDGTFALRTATLTGERFYRVDQIILAIGAMHRPRRLGIPGEDLPHVSHYFRDPHSYFGQRVLIVGGKNSAIEAAIRCQRVGAEVTLCYRGTDFDPAIVKFWLLPEIQAMIRDGRVRMLSGMQPVEILPGITRVRPCHGGALADVANDFVLLLDLLGVDVVGDDRHPSFDPETMETNVPGVFVAGTATAGSPVGKIRVIIESCHVHVTRIVAALARQRQEVVE